MLALISIPALTVNAQKDMGRGWCQIHGNYTGASCPGCGSAGGTTSNTRRISNKKIAKQQRLTEAYEANEQGVKYFNNHDYANAVVFFQEALNKDKGEKVYQNNLITANEQLQIQQQDQLRFQQQEQLRIQQQQLQEQQNKAAALKMQQSIQAFMQTSNKVSSSGGLDFDGNNSTTADPNNSNRNNLQFGDPNLVDARNVPSGLPKATDDAITGAYKNAPPGVSDRVRKGFQAVMTKDWKAAKAWFQDALLLDPGNQGLQKFIALCDYTPGNKPAANTSNNKKPVVVPGPNSPTKVEIDDFFNNFNAGIAFTPSEKVRKYVLAMPKEEFKKQLDIHFTIKQINEIMFESILLGFENNMQSQKGKIPY